MASGKTRKRRLVITELDEVGDWYILFFQGEGHLYETYMAHGCLS